MAPYTFITVGGHSIFAGPLMPATQPVASVWPSKNRLLSTATFTLAIPQCICLDNNVLLDCFVDSILLDHPLATYHEVSIPPVRPQSASPFIIIAYFDVGPCKLLTHGNEAVYRVCSSTVVSAPFRSPGDKHFDVFRNVWSTVSFTHRLILAIWQPCFAYNGICVYRKRRRWFGGVSRSSSFW